jgi:hypothetical protein
MDSNWTVEEKRKIMDVFTALAVSMKSYGNMDHRARLRAWELILGNKYNGEQICSAMLAHAEKSDEIPTPAELIKIINPPEPKITYAEYQYALEQHKAEGYPMFGYFGQVIADYKKQQREEYDTPSYQEILERRSKHVPIGEVMKKIGESKNGN